MSRALPRHDPYAAHRCGCNHLCSYHEADHCSAGDHIARPCGCEGFDGDCTCPQRREGAA